MAADIEYLLAATGRVLLAATAGPDAAAVDREYCAICADPEAATSLRATAAAAAAYLDAEQALRGADLTTAVSGFTIAAGHGFADARRRLAALRRTPRTDAPDHDELVAAARRGDRRALNDLLADLMPIVTGYCRARIGHLPGSERAVDDVVQDVAMAVVKALPTYRSEGRPFVAFVQGIVRNKIADAYRAAMRNHSRPASTDMPERADPAPGPEQLALRDEQAVALGRLLDTLPARQREILIMRVVGRLSAEDVATALGMTAGAVRIAQHRALRALRRRLGGSTENE